MSKPKYIVLGYMPQDTGADITAVVHFANTNEDVKGYISAMATENGLDLNDEEDIAEIYQIIDVYMLGESQDVMDFVTSDIIKVCTDCEAEYALELSRCPECGSHDHRYEM